GGACVNSPLPEVVAQEAGPLAGQRESCRVRCGVARRAQILRELQGEREPRGDLLRPTPHDVLGGRGVVGRVDLDRIERAGVDGEEVLRPGAGRVEGADPGGVVPTLSSKMNLAADAFPGRSSSTPLWVAVPVHPHLADLAVLRFA